MNVPRHLLARRSVMAGYLAGVYLVCERMMRLKAWLKYVDEPWLKSAKMRAHLTLVRLTSHG